MVGHPTRLGLRVLRTEGVLLGHPQTQRHLLHPVVVVSAQDEGLVAVLLEAPQLTLGVGPQALARGQLEPELAVDAVDEVGGRSARGLSQHEGGRTEAMHASFVFEAEPLTQHLTRARSGHVLATAGAVRLEGGRQRQSLGMGALGGHAVEQAGLARAELVELLGRAERELAGGQRAGLVEDHATNLTHAIEQAARAHEETDPAQARADDLVAEGDGDAEGAGAGHHQDRGGDLDGADGVAAGPEPAQATHSCGKQHADDVDARDALPETRSDRHLGSLAGAREQSEHGGGFEARLGPSAQGLISRVEGAGRERLPTDEVTRRALAVDPVERKGRALGEQVRVHGHEVSGCEDERVSGDDVEAWDGLHLPVALPASGHGVDALVREQAIPVALEGALLEEASEQHQGDEHGQRVDVGRLAVAEEEAVARAREGQGDAQGDGQVEVQDAGAHALPRGLEEHAATDQDGQHTGAVAQLREQLVERSRA